MINRILQNLSKLSLVRLLTNRPKKQPFSVALSRHEPIFLTLSTKPQPTVRPRNPDDGQSAGRKLKLAPHETVAKNRALGFLDGGGASNGIGTGVASNQSASLHFCAEKQQQAQRTAHVTSQAVDCEGLQTQKEIL